MKQNSKGKKINVTKTGYEAVILVIFILMAVVLDPQFTGFFAMSVRIIDQTDNIFYEQNARHAEFQITITSHNAWFSFNGSSGRYGGIDIGNYSDGKTETFTLENMGSTTADVLIAAEDVANNTEYIDVGINGNFEIYIPETGWKKIPDNNDMDIDGKKDLTELCIADDLLVGRNITGFDFRIRASKSNSNGRYVSHITITSYNSEKINPCSVSGEYVTP